MKENLNREELSTAISDTRKSFDTDNPIVPFIEGDGIGIDIWPASQKVFDSAVKKAYNNQRKIEWMEVLAGQKAYDNENEWLPEKTIDMFDKYGIGIKGPLTTPVGGGIRSINVTIRQKLDLYACVRPLRWFKRFNPHFIRHFVCFIKVAFSACSNDIFPICFSTLRTRNYMVKRKFIC